MWGGDAGQRGSGSDRKKASAEGAEDPDDNDGRDYLDSDLWTIWWPCCDLMMMMIRTSIVVVTVDLLLEFGYLLFI